jgi:hypothetical protein
MANQREFSTAALAMWDGVASLPPAASRAVRLAGAIDSAQLSS